MNRRRFIFCLSGILAFSLLPLRRALVLTKPGLEDLLFNVTLSLPYDSTRIGSQFNRQSNNLSLEIKIFEEELASIAQFQDATQQRKRFAEICATEFARGETTVIDGWVLSNTELRCCAIKALLS